MTDWEAIAKASGLNLAEADLAKIAAPVKALDETLQPLMKTLRPDLEPALTFQGEGDDE